MAGDEANDDEEEAREVVRDLVHPGTIRPRHDRFARLLLGDPREAAGLLQAVLPPVVAAAIDWSTLHLAPANQIDAWLSEDVRDLVFSARWRGGETVLLVLLEHLSAPDPDILRRIGCYLHGQWEDWRAKHSTGRLPMILPVVLYQGPPAWPGPRRFLEQLAVPPELLSLLVSVVPDFEPIFIELPGASTDELRRLAPTPAARIALALLRDARTGADLIELLRTLGPELRELLSRQEGRRVVRVVLTYTMLVRPGSDGRALMKVMEDMAGQKASALVPGSIGQLMAEAQAKGKAEGKVEGKTEGKAETLERLLLRRFGSIPAPLRERIHSASGEEIDRWSDRIFDATSAQQVVDDIGPSTDRGPS